MLCNRVSTRNVDLPIFDFAKTRHVRRTTDAWGTCQDTLQLTDVPSTSSFTCVGKQRQQYGQYFIALLRITIFHDEANTTSCVGREKLWYRKLEYPPETHPLFVWDPDPHENHLTTERCAACKREQHVPFVVSMRRDVTPDDFRTSKK